MCVWLEVWNIYKLSSVTCVWCQELIWSVKIGMRFRRYGRQSFCGFSLFGRALIRTRFLYFLSGVGRMRNSIIAQFVYRKVLVQGLPPPKEENTINKIQGLLKSLYRKTLIPCHPAVIYKNQVCVCEFGAQQWKRTVFRLMLPLLGSKIHISWNIVQSKKICLSVLRQCKIA